MPLLRDFQSVFVARQAAMPSKRVGREEQDRNFEIVVNHINVDQAKLPHITQQSVAALKKALGHNVKKYSATVHYKPGNDHVHFLAVSQVPKIERLVKACIAGPLALIFGTDAESVEVRLFSELKRDTGPAHGLKGLGDYCSLYVNNNDHVNHRPQDPEHRTLEFLSAGQWEILHGGTRQSAGRRGPLQAAIEAIKVGTPELQCKTYEEFQTLLGAAAESVGCTEGTLPSVPGDFASVPKQQEGPMIRNPAFDEKLYKALPEKEQTGKRLLSMKYLQGPNGGCLKEQQVVAHKFFEGHPPDFYRFRLLEPIKKLQSGRMLTTAKLKQYYEEAFISLFGQRAPRAWLLDRPPPRATPKYHVSPAAMANVMRAR
eukprot:jgi/Astpho2/6332/Aster-05997